MTAALVGLVSIGGLTACASSGSGASAGGAGATVSSSPSASGTSAPAPTATASPPAVGVTVTVNGTVAQGAEPSCLILTTTRGQFELLLPANATVHAGDRVTATGHVVRVMSHCMQGQPFQVDTLSTG
jgi:hypothetical protein